MRLISDGKVVSVDHEAIERRAEDLADQRLDDYTKRNPNLTSEDYDELVSTYQKAYMGRIMNDIGEVAEKNPSAVVWWLNNQQEVELRNIAIRNNEAVRPIGLDNRIGYHKRDLGLLHIMDLYGISVQQALSNVEDLKKIHMLADKYDDLQKQAGNEVKWPEKANFQ